MREIKYKGQAIDSSDIEIVWHDHYGNEFKGNLEDFVMSRIEDALEEHDAGDGW